MYKVITESDPNALAARVATYLAAGWRLQGGVSLVPQKVQTQYDYLWAQAIAKEPARQVRSER